MRTVKFISHYILYCSAILLLILKYKIPKQERDIGYSTVHPEENITGNNNAKSKRATFFKNPIFLNRTYESKHKR